MIYLKLFENFKENEIDIIIDELKDLLYDINDDGFDSRCSKFFTTKYSILVYIVPDFNNKITNELVNNIFRIINYMNQIGYNLGSNEWFKNNLNNLRISQKKMDYKIISFEDLKSMIGLDFSSIELCFDN